MSVTLEEVLVAARERVASLAAEVAGYLVLAAADQTAGAPRSASLQQICLETDGAVRLVGGRPASESEAEDALRATLSQLLEESSSVTPALFRAAQRAGCDGVGVLIRELEAALIPVNRAAARRALSRLHRDVTRAKLARPDGLAGGAVESRAPASRRVAPHVVDHGSVELPEVLARPSDPGGPPSMPPASARAADFTDLGAGEPRLVEPVRSWRTPETVQVSAFESVEPLDSAQWHAPFQPGEELETACPAAVQESEDAAAIAEPVIELAEQAPLLALPVVPDLDVPPSPMPPSSRRTEVAASAASPELEQPATVPQPAVVLASKRQAARASNGSGPDPSRTPALGSVAERVVFVPVPATPSPAPTELWLEAEEATERAPLVLTPLVEAQIEQALDAVIEAFAETAEPPESGEIDRGWSAPLLPSAPPPLASEVLAAAEPPAEDPPEEALATLDPPCAEEHPLELELDAAAPFPEEAPVPDESCFEPVLELGADAISVDLDGSAPRPRVALRTTPLPDDEALAIEVEDLPELEADALETLAALPPRPREHRYAPPRYAPRKSDVSELLSDFSVAGTRSERELCSDLKLLAGVDRTAPPPSVVLTGTPPPVAVSTDLDASEEPAPRDRGSVRAVAGAVSAALVLAGVGFGAIPTRAHPRVAAAAPGQAEPSTVSEPAREKACAAEITVKGLAPAARARLRPGPARELVAPSRVSASEAVFEALPCREAVEVSIQLPGKGRWTRIPVSADQLSPSADAPSFVRYTVAAR